MLRITILILFTVCFHSLFATVYYVGGTGSSDSNPGTATQPFATIQKAASVAVAGDVINIRAGVYRETVVPTNSGSPGNPIIFQAEGGGVVINGGDQVNSAWTVHSGNIYKTSITLPVNGYQTAITSNTTILANQVFKDRVMMFEARWPDYSSLDDLLDRTKVRSLAQSVSFGSTSITDNGFPQTSLAGGVMWFVGWMSSGTRVINSHSGNTITFNTVNPDQKFRQFFYVTGKLGLLNVEKEWHYENNTLYLWQPGGGAPTNVEYKVRNFGFNLTNKANITIKGLEFFACEPMTGNTNSTGITLDGIKAKYTNHSVMQAQTGDVNNNNAKQTGIKLIGSNSVIKNSEIQYSASQGIWLGENCVAHNNLIKDNNYEGNYAAAITPWMNTNNQKITYNTITRTGRSPIYVGGSGSEFGSHTNMDIGYNDLSVYGMLNVDLGAVYGDLQTNLTGTRVHHNWVYDSRARLFDEGIQTGIYFDQYSGPVTIDHNVCWNNVTADFYVEKNKVNYLYNNVFATTTGGRSYVTYRNTPSDVQRNNIYRGDLSLSGGGDPGNIQNSLYKNIDPQFVGTGNGGLVYRLKSTSPGVNAGTPISGITDGSSGAPDIGAYEIGTPDWIPGYTPQSTAPNTPPVVSITAPANNTSFAQGVSINISVNAADGNGTIKRVEFFDGTTKIGEDLSYPYTFTWSNASAGARTLTAKATDNEDAVTTSTPVTITVTQNTAPAILITAPATNAQFNIGNTITISATATDANGSVSKVEFFDGTTKLGEDLSTPYSFVWTNGSTGVHTLTAKATDNENGITTSAAVTITINNPLPIVSLTSPSSNSQIITGTPITITATASDANGSISKVEFFSGATKLGEDLTSPYSFVWNNAPIGVYSLTAKATDNDANIVTSATVSVTVIVNPPPTVSITSPAANTQIITGTPITITATASDANGSISKVEFFSGATKLGEDLVSPYSFVWNNAPIGVYSLTAQATDNDGNIATSATVSVTVSVNPPPTVSITSPAANTQIITGTPITITATASDANGSISKVEFFSGVTKLGEDLASPYSFVWNNAPIGVYSLTAKATDNDGNIVTSATVSVTVIVNPPPTVSITSPAANTQIITGTPITITATASDANGSVSKVEFFSGATKLGEDLTSPYSLVWNNASVGGHSITAKATDNQTNVGTSAAVSITVNANPPPSVLITGPSNNNQFTTGAPVNIAATASDTNGAITKVEFFNGTTKLGEDTTIPYNFQWTNAPKGSHTLIAKATDNQAASASSAAVTINIIDVNVPPTVSITSPLSNTRFTSGSSITIAASAADVNGSVTKVEFFQGTTKLGEDATSPYSFVWTNVPAGTYSLSAKALDNQSASATSASISIIVNTAPTISFQTPANNSSFNAGSTITFTAVASDPNGTVSNVEFFNGTTKLGQDLTAPYTFAWVNVPAGTYSITAKATDNQNGATSTEPLKISVVSPVPAPPTNIVSPTANAGEDVTVSLPENSGTLTALEIPQGESLQFKWVQLSGPSTVTISNSASQEIEITGLIEGVYVMELTVTDNATGLSSKDLVQISVVDDIPVQTLQTSIPRFFSPNDDGKGDLWEWRNVDKFENSILTVFNRSGQKIYETISYKNNWNGKVGNTPLQAGDYYYIIQLINNTFIRGALQIIR